MNDDTTELRAAADWLEIALAAARGATRGNLAADRDRIRAIADAATAEFGARFRLDREPQVMRMAGLTVSTTAGSVNLMNLWLAKARALLPEVA
jgi:hypothetical protein